MSNRRVDWVTDNRCTVIPDWQHIRAREKVNTGFADNMGFLTAPPEWGLYTLYEEVYPETNVHRCWIWIKEC